MSVSEQIVSRDALTLGDLVDPWTSSSMSSVNVDTGELDLEEKSKLCG